MFRYSLLTNSLQNFVIPMHDRMKTRIATLGAVLALTSFAARAPSARKHVDRIFVNGQIWTGDGQRPKAEALAVADDKILAVGSTAEIKALADSQTAVVDLNGKLV